MKWARALYPALLAGQAMAVTAAGAAPGATAYVSDELILGLYTEQNGQGQRLATLHSGAVVESLEVSGEFTKVRLADGMTGWVKTSYLTTRVPATVRLQQLEEELDRSRATTPQLAEAAAHSETDQLKRQLAAMQTEVDAARAGIVPNAAGASPKVSWTAIGAALLALPLGFWLGYATLARRVKHKFGGLKVY